MRPNPYLLTRASLLLPTLLLAACSTPATYGPPLARAQIAPTAAAPAAGMNPAGLLEFRQAEGVVFVSGRITGLKPGATHGFHFHEVGDCANEGMASRGHFNPDGKNHGMHGAEQAHAGDLPALRADASGTAELRFELRGVNLDVSPRGLLGRAVVVHRDPDDFKTQPTGNSGPRPGCGVIEAAR
ncbi:MAG TPA: superoxide dismutase family protein [Burkholderiaceae bacterium]|nr:superoxide dismutase family protein [Burkholderiaceae bacterium]